MTALNNPTHDNHAIPTRSLLRYFGGKWAIAPWVLSHLPPHRIYVEPFGGAASILLRKPRSRIEVYNDLDEEIVGIFRIGAVCAGRPTAGGNLRRRFRLVLIPSSAPSAPSCGHTSRFITNRCSIRAKRRLLMPDTAEGLTARRTNGPTIPEPCWRSRADCKAWSSNADPRSTSSAYRTPPIHSFSSIRPTYHRPDPKPVIATR